MKKILPILFFFFASVSTAHAFTLSHFQTPESAQVDPEDGSYYISNINGAPTDKDGNGYISKISASGNLSIQKFIGGKNEPVLNAPKGLVILGRRIYVADIDTVKVFDKKTKELLTVVDLAPFHAKFLNDIAADEKGDLFVSDTIGNQLFKIQPSKKYEVTLFKKGAALGRPNGLLVNPKSKNLMVAGFESGQLMEIDPAGNIHILKKGLSSLDGMDHDREGNLYISSFEKGEIYRVPLLGRGALGIYLSGLTTPADISFDRRKNELVIPSFKGNTVTTVDLRTIRPGGWRAGREK